MIMDTYKNLLNEEYPHFLSSSLKDKYTFIKDFINNLGSKLHNSDEKFILYSDGSIAELNEFEKPVFLKYDCINPNTFFKFPCEDSNNFTYCKLTKDQCYQVRFLMDQLLLCC